MGEEEVERTAVGGSDWGVLLLLRSGGDDGDAAIGAGLQDAVDGVDVGFGRGVQDVHVRTLAVEPRRLLQSVVRELHRDLSHSVRARRHGLDLELQQGGCNSRDPGNGLKDRVHGTVPRRRVGVLGVVIVVLHSDRGRGGHLIAGRDLQAVQGPQLARLVDVVVYEASQIRLSHGLLLVCQNLEPREDLPHLSRGDVRVPHLLQLRGEGIHPGVLSQDQGAAAQPDNLRANNLVGLLVLQHAILVDPALVGEGVGPYNRLVGLYGHSSHRSHQLAASVDLIPVQAILQLQRGVMGVQNHSNLLQSGVTGSLADPIDGTLDLPRARHNSRQSVRSCQAQIIVAVQGPCYPVGALGVLNEVLHPLEVLVWRGVPHGVGDVQSGGPSLNHSGQHLCEELHVAASRILGRELHVVDQGAGILHSPRRSLHALLAAHPEFVLQVNVAGGQEGVHAVQRGVLHSLAAPQDVLLFRSGQPANPHRDSALAVGGDRADLAGDPLDSLKVTLGGDREPRLANVYPQATELVRDCQLLVNVQRAPW
eukprot:RCo021954